MKINKKITKLGKKILLLFISISLFTTSSPALAAPPSSTNYILNVYGFGAGGVATSSSQSFLMQGIAGEIETASPSSTNFLAQPGLTFLLQPNTPTGPNISNPSNYYNKLSIIINNGNNPSDTTFLIQIASGSADFSSNSFYVQADNTLGTEKVWRTYSDWGGVSGFNIIGLYPGTTYYARVKPKSGVFQEGSWSAVSNAATQIPTLTFDINTTSQTNPPFTVNIGTLTAGNITTSTDKIDVTITTNATNGGLIYLYGSNNGLVSTTAGNYSINSVTNNLSSISEGYGARGTTTSESAGGPMELVSPYNGSGENVGIIDTAKRPISDSSGAPVTNGLTRFELKAKVSNTTPSANDYTDVITIIGTGDF